MKFILSVFFISISIFCYSQNIDCDFYYENHCKNHPCTQEIDAFCDGIENSLKSNGLAIMEYGHRSNADPCLYHSYEKWGVKLILYGNDIIIPDEEESLEGKKEGFNYIMLPKIKSQLGEDYPKLGKIDSSWFSIKNSTLHNIQKSLKIKLINDTTALLKFKKKLFKDNQIKNLKGVLFIDFWSKKTITYQELIKGVKITIKLYGLKGRAWLRLNFKNHKNPNICKCGYIYNLPVLFKTE